MGGCGNHSDFYLLAGAFELEFREENTGRARKIESAASTVGGLPILREILWWCSDFGLSRHERARVPVGG